MHAMRRHPRLSILAIAVLLPGFITVAQVREYRPVTEAMLLKPAPGDWPNWRRTLDGWGYSPLDQINTKNAHQLQLAWSWGIPPGQNQTTPLVVNGMMFIPTPGGGVHALDAATGDLLWEYSHTIAGGGPPRTSPMRNLAVFSDKVYVAASDARLVALDARTGKVRWDHQVADPKLGYAYSSGPIIVKGMVVAGINGCQRYKNDVCFISAHDADSGKELWRTSTIARPDEPGGDTWGDLPLMFRAGGDAWIAGSYDPQTNLIFWGTSQAKPWTRFARGTDGDALYTNSTLAIDPATGKIAWYYQHIPGETLDMDETFERILVDRGGRSSVFTMGKVGILWELDRKTGKFLSARDLGYQNVLDVDPVTGKATYRANMIPKPGVELDFCPSSSGFKSLRAMAYHPQTQAFYIPLNLHCEKGTFFDTIKKVEGGGGSGGVKRINTMHPASPDGIGEFLALGADGKVLWRRRTRTPPNTAALTTGGGLVVIGDWDRYMSLHDAANGKIVFQTRLPNSAHGFPITYAVNGKQYIAMLVGSGGAQWATTITADLLPEKKSVTGVNAVFVFSLPER